MADNDEEKSELPTAKRLSEARDKGQVAYSKEFSSAVIFFASLVTLKLLGRDVVEDMRRLLESAFSLPIDAFLEDSNGRTDLVRLVADAMTSTIPFVAVGVVAALLPGFTQVGLHFSSKRLEVDFTRLNPISGMKRIFSSHSLAVIVADMVKMTLIGAVLWFTLQGAIPDVEDLTRRSLGSVIEFVMELVFAIAWRVASGLLVIGIVDWLFRRWKHRRDLMMSKQEVKEEHRQSEGDPQTKRRIKDAMRAAALKRMKTDVKGADVVVRNPTHFAVALKYVSGRDPAPRVVAKGRNILALSIIRIAEENGVSVVVNPPLAREIYKTVRLGDVIPERLFRAVAEILSVVFKKRRHEKAEAGR